MYATHLEQATDSKGRNERVYFLRGATEDETHVAARAKDSCTHILDVLSNMVMRPHPTVITAQAPHMIGRYDPVRVTTTPEDPDSTAPPRE